MTDNPRKKEPPEPSEAEPAPPESAQAEPVETGTLEEHLARAQEDAQKYLGNWQRAEADF